MHEQKVLGSVCVDQKSHAAAFILLCFQDSTSECVCVCHWNKNREAQTRIQNWELGTIGARSPLANIFEIWCLWILNCNLFFFFFLKRVEYYFDSWVLSHMECIISLIIFGIANLDNLSCAVGISSSSFLSRVFEM